MSRRRRHRRSSSYSGGKPAVFPSRRLPRIDLDLRLRSDRRLWHPDPYRVDPTTFGQRAYFEAQTVKPRHPRRGFSLVPPKIRYKRATEVLSCIRRSRRREVLFAYQRAGKRGLGRGKPRRLSHDSDISC